MSVRRATTLGWGLSPLAISSCISPLPSSVNDSFSGESETSFEHAEGSSGAPSLGDGESTSDLSPTAPLEHCALLIDDFEDGDSRTSYINGSTGISGSWFTFDPDNAIGTINPNINERFQPKSPGYDSAYAANVVVLSVRNPNAGPGLGVTLHHPDCQVVHDSDCIPDPMNRLPLGTTETSLSGISFQGRSRSDQPARFVFQVHTAETLPSEFGGSCKLVAPDDCFAAFSVEVELVPTWQQYRIQFNQLELPYGPPKSFELEHVLTFQWQAIGSTAPTIAIDNLCFE